MTVDAVARELESEIAEAWANVEVIDAEIEELEQQRRAVNRDLTKLRRARGKLLGQGRNVPRAVARERVRGWIEQVGHPTTTAEIARALGTYNEQVRVCVQDLIAEGAVRETGRVSGNVREIVSVNGRQL